MTTHQELLKCEHPIIGLAMNGVSDAKLSVAISKAGCLPSLSIPTYLYNHGKDCSDFITKDIDIFYNECGHGNIILSMTDDQLISLSPYLIRVCVKYKISHLEIILTPVFKDGKPVLKHAYNMPPEILKMIYLFRRIGVKIIMKTIGFPYNARGLFETLTVDAVIIKSHKGAGTIPKLEDMDNELKIEDKIKIAKNNIPDNMPIIACGGIGTYSEIQSCLAAGATAIGIGTLFALSEESCISEKSKLETIRRNSEKLDRLNNEQLQVVQSALVFAEYERQDNMNHSGSLKRGIEGRGGHLFIGEGFRHVNEILPVKEIVRRLITPQ